MEVKKDILVSSNLEREMSINVYGHYGISVLMFSAFTDSSSEYEENGLINTLEPMIKMGKCKLFCISGLDSEMWFSNDKDPKEKSHLHFKYNHFIEDEVVPYIYGQCGGPLPIITAGASKGAYHAANTFFRRPDIFMGTIAISGYYDLSILSGNYFDDNCYYNSPIHYLPNLSDTYWLSLLYSRRHIYISSGSGSGEHPHHSEQIAGILNGKGIRHHFELRGSDYAHDYASWGEFLKYFIEERL